MEYSARGEKKIWHTKQMKDKTRLKRQTSGTEEILPGEVRDIHKKKGKLQAITKRNLESFSARKCFGAITGYVQRKSSSHVTESGNALRKLFLGGWSLVA